MENIQHDFMIGDRVRCIEDWCDPVHLGDEGTVVNVYTDNVYIAVAWDVEDIEKHSCDGRCAKGHGWLLPHDCLELVAPATSEDLTYMVLPLDELFGLQDDSESGKISAGVMY